MGDDEITFYEWKHLFAEICYAYEPPYKPTYRKLTDGTEFVTFYKLTIYANGDITYKGQVNKYDPKLWPKVLLIYKTFEEGGVLDILYDKEKA